MNKKLYFLHIPKTGGQTLIQTIVPILDDNGIKYHKNLVWVFLWNIKFGSSNK